MNANKQLLNRTGQIGILFLFGSMTAAMFAGGSVAFVSVMTGILGYYLLTHQDFSVKEFFSIGGSKHG